MSALRVAVATGTRAEFGLLAPVMRAIQAEGEFELRVIVAGAHLLPPAFTRRDVEREFAIAAEVPMQRADRTGRLADAAALGRGVAGFAATFEEDRPDCVLVLGDRIEAFAAASAASVGGIPLAHLHGGDRAEGVADEAMRHAITKLAHLHLPATEASAERIRRMGEDPARVRVVGSPAIDGLAAIPAMGDADAAALGDPDAVLLLHPVGDAPAVERARAERVIEALGSLSRRVLALHPNHDPGREGVLEAIERSGVRAEAHLERPRFVGLLRRLAERGGVLIGNSSAGLIEAAALRLPVVDIGERQAGRERAGNAVWSDGGSAAAVAAAVRSALGIERSAITHPYGDGRTGERVAAILAAQERGEAARRARLRKRCVY